LHAEALRDAAPTSRARQGGPAGTPVDSDQSYRVTRTSAPVSFAENLAITSNAMRRASLGSRANATSNVNRLSRKVTRHWQPLARANATNRSTSLAGRTSSSMHEA